MKPLITIVVLAGMLCIASNVQAAPIGGWEFGTPLPQSLFHGTVAVSGKYLYSFGGAPTNTPFPAVSVFDTVNRFDRITGTWTAMASMPTARWGAVSFTALDGSIYIAGGMDANGMVIGMDRYDPFTNTWTTLSSSSNINTERAAASGVVDSSGRFYLIGGWNGMFSGDFLISSVERFDPLTETWSLVAAMDNGRSNFGAAIDKDGLIYAMGRGGATEQYDPILNQWNPVSSMLVSGDVQLHATTGADGLIYAVGGFRGAEGYIDATQIYDPVHDTWTFGPTINDARNNAGLVALGNTLYLIGGDTPADRGATVASVETITVTPEPGTLALMAVGLLGVARNFRRKKT